MSHPTTGPTSKSSWPKRQVAKLKTKLKQKLGPQPPSNTKTDIYEFLNPPSQTVSSESASNISPRKPVAEDKQETSATSEESNTGESQDMKASTVEISVVTQDLARQINQRTQVPISATEPDQPPIPATVWGGETTPVTERETIDDILKTGSPASKGIREVDPGMMSGIDSDRGTTGGELTSKLTGTAEDLSDFQNSATIPAPPVKALAPPSSAAGRSAPQQPSSAWKIDRKVDPYEYGHRAGAYATYGSLYNSSQGYEEAGLIVGVAGVAEAVIEASRDGYCMEFG